MSKKREGFYEFFGGVVGSLQRNVRECSLPQLLLLLELAGAAGGVSTLALVRRLMQRGAKNPRQVLLRARERGLVYCRQEEDALVWRMSDEGELVLYRAIERIRPKT